MRDWWRSERQQVRRFLELTATERALLVRAALAVGIFRLGLWVLPFRTVRQMPTRARRRSDGSPRSGRPSPDRVAWAVTVASRYLPAVTCLTQALATQTLLSWYGHPTNLRIGVMKDESGQLQAHAWVESEGAIVIGGPETQLQRYTSLTALEGKGS